MPIRHLHKKLCCFGMVAYWVLGLSAAAEEHYIPHARSATFSLNTALVASGGQGSAWSSAALSGAFPVDTRQVHPQSDGFSVAFRLDSRVVDGVSSSAVSGSAFLNTGGYQMGVPVVLGMSPAEIPGSDQRQWITLRGANLPQGASVTLRTNGQTFRIPAERTQWVGSTEVRIFVNVSSMAADWTVEVAGVDGIASARVTFRVGGAVVSPARGVDYGTLAVGTAREELFTLRNLGTASATWSAAVGSGMFTIVGGSSGTLAAGASTQVTLRYAPSAIGAHAATAHFSLAGQTHVRELAGRAQAAAVAETYILRGKAVMEFTSIIVSQVENAAIWITPGSSSAVGVTRKVYADSKGDFSVDRLTPGPYQVRVMPPRFLDDRLLEKVVEVQVAPGMSPIQVRLDPKPIPPVRTEITPVVLVRGMGKRGAGEDAYWQEMRDALEADGFVVLDPNRNGAEIIDGERNYFHNAGVLRTYILDSVQDLQNDGYDVSGIHLVAHSMGGMICREMISRIDNQNFVLRRLPPVQTLVTLSTPHAGSKVADVAKIFSAFPSVSVFRPTWESTRSLTTGRVRTYSPAWPADNHIRLAVAAGTTAGDDWELQEGSRVFTSVADEGEDGSTNDGAVSLASSFGYYRKPPEIGRLIGALIGSTGEKVETFPAASTWSGALIVPPKQFPLNHFEMQQNGAVISWVKDILHKRQATRIQPRSAMLRSSTLAASAAEPEFVGQVVDELLLTAGQNPTQQSVPLSGNGAAQFIFHFTGAAPVIRLGSPAGTWLTGGGAGVSWQMRAPTSTVPGVLTVKLDEPTAGNWVIETWRSGGADVSVACLVREDGELNLEVNTGDLVAIGAAVPLRASAILNNGTGGTRVTGGEVRATVISPSGATVERSLPDDGMQGDEATGDGLHGLLAGDFITPGVYEVIFRYAGVHPTNDAAFKRMVRGSFTRAVEGGFISGIEGHRVIDIDQDGFSDAVILDVRVDHQIAGDFILAGSLHQINGSGVCEASAHFQRDTAGATIVNLVFEKRGLPMGRECGPFEVSKLRLLRVVNDEPLWVHDLPPGYGVAARMFNGYARHLRVTGNFNVGRVRVGQSVTTKLRIHNDGWQEMIVSGLELPRGFSGSFVGTIKPGESHEMDVTFTPREEGIHGGSFIIFSDANAGAELSEKWQGEAYMVQRLRDWLADQGALPNQMGALDDPNGDGVPNLLAFLYNRPAIGPVQNTNQALLSSRSGTDGNGRFVALRYRHHRRAEDLRVEIMASSDLTQNSWEVVTPDEVVEIGLDVTTFDPIRELRFHIPNNAGARFYKLKVTED